MKRTLIVVAVLVAFATAASGATISIVSNKLTYNVGDTIHITFTGNAQTSKDNGIYGKLLYSAALTDTVTSSQTQLTVGGQKTPITGNLARGDGFAEIFDQIIDSGGVNRTVDNLQIATATLVAQAAGTVVVNWATGTLDLDFFGLSTATNPNPALTFTIGAVPEPATAALIGLGLLGLALGGRRRS